jgi:SOS-response transcriptional repressor LexA
MMKVGEYLKKQRELSDMSLRDAGAAAGLSHVHVKEIEDGVTAPSFDKVMRILKAYHADLQDFLRATGYLPKNTEPAALGKMRKIPVISWVAAGKWTETGETFLDEDIIEWIETDVKGEHNFGLKIKGDSMEPEFKEGEVVVINPTAKAENGDYVIVKNHEEEATFKQYKRYDNTKILHPLNPRYNDIVLNKDKEYRIVGVVMEKKKRYK